MANRTGKSIDKTFLSVDNAEQRGFIHRDYIAHCLRWSHVMKFLGNKYKTARILDVGCGKEAPLAKMLYSSKMPPEAYVGVDYGKIEPGTFGKYEDRFEFWEQEDFAEFFDFSKEHGGFNVVTCFEMLEHIEPEHVLRTLDNIKSMCSPDADIFISTPVFNGKAAGNHVNEMTYEAFRAVLLQQGFEVIDRWGTFASITDYRDQMDDRLTWFFNEMRAYYDVNVLSCIMAPFFPEESRNVLWHVKPTQNIQNLPKWENVSEPWSSSDKWKELKR